MIIPAIETLSNTSAVATFKSNTCDDLHYCRTIWNIIWSCLGTLFACTWLSIHMNIPSPDDSRGATFARRTLVMVLALLSPEFIVGWAARQRNEAKAIENKNKAYGWTRAHGFFVVMGGFMEYDEDDQPVRTLDHEDNIPAEAKESISEQEILDKSKGDVLSKGFALLQTGWFILQCISRQVAGLPITQLEIATVAFAVLNFATYIIWWDKPLNVNKPVRVYRSRSEGSRQNVVVEAQAENTDKEGLEAGWKSFKTWVRTTWRDLRTGWKGLWADLKQCPVDFVKEVHRPIPGIRSDLKKNHGGKISPLLLLAIPFTAISAGYRPTEGRDEKRVGTFSPNSRRLESRPFVMSVVVARLFGGIHLLAWNFDFPSRPEHYIWCVSAVCVTVGPFLSLVVLRLSNALEGDSNCIKGPKGVLDFFVFMSVLCFVSRVALIVLPLMSLRSLPSGAYHTTDWTRFIPHIS